MAFRQVGEHLEGERPSSKGALGGNSSCRLQTCVQAREPGEGGSEDQQTVGTRDGIGAQKVLGRRGVSQQMEGWRMTWRFN